MKNILILSLFLSLFVSAYAQEKTNIEVRSVARIRFIFPFSFIQSYACQVLPTDALSPAGQRLQNQFVIRS